MSSGCLLGRLAKVGEASNRGAWSKRECKEFEKEERREHWQADVPVCLRSLEVQLSTDK